MKVLTEEDLRFFDENGYVVVRGAVPPENCRAVVDALFEFLGMDPDDPNDWYREPLTPGGMVEMYQHPAMWANRQHPRVHAAFADLFGHERLWVSFDRVNLKPPYHPDHPRYNHLGFMHWDTDVTTAARQPFGVQGVLYLADTTAEAGGFQCSPGHHKTVLAWAKERERAPDEKPDMADVPVVPITGAEGDLVIWNRLLYHGNGHNRTDKPRLAQYITMSPAPTGDEFSRRREERIHQWMHRLPPNARWVVGDKRGWEPAHGTTAPLTPLGRRLLGLDAWEESA
jgi:hypothetical protein